MKMVSQLTRQAMSRHRLLSTVAYPDTPASPPPASEHQAVRTLYAPEPPAVSYAPVPQPACTSPVPDIPTARIPQQRTIYGELMKKHDQFTERHLIKR